MRSCTLRSAVNKVALSDLNLREVAPLELNSSKGAPLEFLDKIAASDLNFSEVAPLDSI